MRARTHTCTHNTHTHTHTHTHLIGTEDYIFQNRGVPCHYRFREEDFWLDFWFDVQGWPFVVICW